MFLDLRKGKALEKRQNGKIENGKTYLEDLELILYRCRHLKHPEATLVSQGALRACSHDYSCYSFLYFHFVFLTHHPEGVQVVW